MACRIGLRCGAARAGTSEGTNLKEHMVTPVYPWMSDQRDGTYRNPVVCADYSDPDVIRDGDDYFMTASSFTDTPGLPILHSRDLVNWRLINHAVKNLPHERYARVQPGCGVWAPSIRKHDGKFWIFFPMPDEGIYVTTADHPAATWSRPHLLQEGKGLIDPCPLWDDDGSAYLAYAYARSRAGIKDRLRVSPMSPDGRRLIGEGQIVFHEPERHPTLEGPKFHKLGDYYYLSAPAGGVATGWQLILRSRHVYGPYEEKVVLAQRDTPVNGPHQGAMVDAPDGRWWFVHFQDAGVYGRIVHTQPVRWEDGWPLMGVDQDDKGVGKPVLRYDMPVKGAAPQTPATSDEFDGPALGLQWQWHANHDDDWCSLTARKGWLRLKALPALDDLGTTPSLLLQKLPARAFAAMAHVELGQGLIGQAGLIVTGKTHAALMLDRSAMGEGSVETLKLIVDNQEVVSVGGVGGAAVLLVEMADGGVCRFGYAAGAGEPVTWLSRTFAATEGQWIGAKVGLVCRASAGAGRSDALAGHADIDCFRFAAPGTW